MKGRFSVYSVVLLLCCFANGALKANGQTVTLEGKDFLSPEIVIISPAGNVVVDHNTILLKGAVLSYKLPITEITFLLNGVVVGKQKPPNQATLKFEFELSVTLKPGDNVLTVVGANSKSSSKRDSGKITYQTTTNLAKPNLAVLAVGISHYKDSELKFAESDAREFAERLKSQEGCLFQKITLRVLGGEQASREGILKGLNWLNEAAPANSDVRILFISGRSARDGFGAHYLLSQEHASPEDFELSDIKLDLLFNKLAATPNPAILFLDTSYGGLSYGREIGAQQRGVSKPGRYTPGNVTAFIGSMGNTASIERDVWHHSAFTMALLEALSGKADTSQDKYVDVDELQRWLTKRVSDLTNGKQQPFYLSEPSPKPQPVFCNTRP